MMNSMKGDSKEGPQMEASTVPGISEEDERQASCSTDTNSAADAATSAATVVATTARDEVVWQKCEEGENESAVGAGPPADSGEDLEEQKAHKVLMPDAKHSAQPGKSDQVAAGNLFDLLKDLKLEKFHEAVMSETGAESLDDIVENIEDKTELQALVDDHGMKPLQLNKLFKKIQDLQKERMGIQFEKSSDISSSGTRSRISCIDMGGAFNVQARNHEGTSSSVGALDINPPASESSSARSRVDASVQEPKHQATVAALSMIDKIPKLQLQRTLPKDKYEALEEVVKAVHEGPILSEDRHNLERMIEECFECKEAEKPLQETCKVLSEKEPSLIKFTLPEESRWLRDLEQASTLRRPDYKKKFAALSKRDPSLAYRIWHQRSEAFDWLDLPERCNYLDNIKSHEDEILLDCLEDAKEQACDSSSVQAPEQQSRINDQLLPELRQINEALAAKWVQRNLHDLKYEWVMEPSNMKGLMKADHILAGKLNAEERDLLLEYFAIEPDEASTLPWEQFCKVHFTPAAVEELKTQQRLEPLNEDETEDLVQKLIDLIESKPLEATGPVQCKQHLLWILRDFAEDLSVLGLNLYDLVVKVGLSPEEDGVHLLYQATMTNSDLKARDDSKSAPCHVDEQVLEPIASVLPFLSLINTILKEFAPMYFRDVVEILVPAIVQDGMQSMEDLVTWLGKNQVPESMTSGVHRFLQQLSSVKWDQIYGDFSEGPFRAESESMSSLNYVDKLTQEGTLIRFHVQTFACSPIDENAVDNKVYKRACEILKKHKVYTMEVAMAESLEKLVTIENVRKVFCQHLKTHAEAVSEMARNLQVQLYFAHGSLLKPEKSPDGCYQYDLKKSAHRLTRIVVSSKTQGVPEAALLYHQAGNFEDSNPRLDRPAPLCCIDADAKWPRVVKYGETLPPVRLVLDPSLKKFKVKASARGCRLEGAEMVGRDGEVEAHLQLQNSDSQLLVFSTVVVLEVQDGHAKGMKFAFPPIQVEGVRVSQSKNERGQYISAATSVGQTLHVQQGVPFRLGFDLLVPIRGTPWSISVKDTKKMLRQVQHAEFTAKTGTLDLVFPEGQTLQSPWTESELHVEVSVPNLDSQRYGRNSPVKRPRTTHDLVFSKVLVHRSPKVRSCSWLWAALHDYKPDEQTTQLQKFSAETLHSFPMLLPNGNEIRMTLELNPSDEHDSANLVLHLHSSAPLPEYKLVFWLQDGPRAAIADSRDTSKFCHQFTGVEVGFADISTFYVQLDCKVPAKAPNLFAAEPFLSEFQDTSDQLGEMKPVDCLAKLGELGFSQDGREKHASRNLRAACGVAERMGLDLRNLRRADLLVLCPLDLVHCLEELHFFPSSLAVDACPAQQVNRLVGGLDPLLRPTWSLEEPWAVSLGLFHLMHGLRGVEPLKQLLGVCPSESLEEIGKRTEIDMRSMIMRFHNKYQTSQGNKEIAERFKTSSAEEGEDKYDDSWNLLTTKDMSKLHTSILDAAARHGRTLPRACQLREFEEFRLNFPDAAEERVLEMGHNEVLLWCKKFEGIFEDESQNKHHSADFLLDCIKRLRNEPRWPPAWPVHIVLDEPRPRIRVTQENGAHSYTFAIDVPSKAKIFITEGGIIQQNYFLNRSKNVEDADCGFELEQNPAGKPLETYFRDLREAPQSEISLELDGNAVALKWREQPPRAINATDCDVNILLPCHATDVTHVSTNSGKRVTFKRFLLKITGDTSSQQLKDFLQKLTDRATLKRKCKGGWFETAEQLKDIIHYILNPIPVSPDQGPGLVYNFSPTMLDCMVRARVPNARRQCREAVGLHNVALEADETKRELVKVLIPNEDGERVKTLVFEPNRWKEMAKWVEALKSMGMLVEAFSLDLTSFDTFLQWLQQQQSVTAPLFVCVRVTGKLSLSNLARVHKVASNNEALSILLQVDQHVAAALYMTGILRDPTVMKVSSANGVAHEMVLFRSHELQNGEPRSEVGRCILCAAHAMKCLLAQQDMQRESPETMPLAANFEDVAKKLKAARQIYPFSETCQLRLIHGDVDAARDAFKEHSGDHMGFIDVAADLDLYQCISRISASEQVTEVIVLHSHFLSEVQKKSLLEEFGAQQNADAEWARDRVSITFVSPTLHPADFELGPEAVVQWVQKPILDRRKQINRVLGALRLVMTKEIMAEVEDTQGLLKAGEQDDMSQGIIDMLEAKISKHMEYVLPRCMKASAMSLLSTFMDAVFKEVKQIENLEQDEVGILPFTHCPRDSREAVMRLAQCAVRVQGVLVAQDRLVPFQVFRELLIAGGILPQQFLVEQWAAQVFAPLWSSRSHGEPAPSTNWTPLGGGNPLHSNHLLLYFLTDHSLQPGLGYLVMQKDSVSTERNAFMERLIRGEDVDYNEVSRLAQFPWGHQCFMQMLCCCPLHMVPKLVVLVPPKQFFIMLWNSCPQKSQAAREAFKRLKQMVLDPVLIRLSEDGGSFAPVPIAEHMAVARWCILKVDGTSSEVELRNQDINTLLQMREHVAGIQHMAAQFPFLVPQMLTLDTPRGFVYQQLAFRHVLLTADTDLRDTLFGRRGGKLGAILIEFLLHPRVPRNSASEILQHPFTLFWHNFIDQNDAPELQPPTSEVKDLLLRMSPAAFGQVLESCPSRGHVDTLVKFMLNLVSAENNLHHSLVFWKGFLNDVVQRTFPLKLRALDCLCLSKCSSFRQAAQSCSMDLVNQATLMMRVFTTEDPSLWREHVNLVGFLPLVESDMLTNMIIHQFEGIWTSEVESKVRLLLGIVDKDGFQKLFRLLKKGSLKFLAWATMPVESLSLYLNSLDDFKHLNQIVAIPQVRFKEQVRLNKGSASSVARFLCKKSLPRDEFLHFAEMIGAPKGHIDQTQRTFVICQKDDRRYAPYILQVKAWALSVDELSAASAFVDSLYEDGCKPFEMPGQNVKSEDFVHKYNFDVSSGFSHDILKRNLNALLQSSIISHCNINDQTQQHIQAVLWCWFESIMPSGENSQDLVLGNWLRIPQQDFERYCPNEYDLKSHTYFPLPAVANSSVQYKSVMRMFECGRESASFTLSLFSSLTDAVLHPSIKRQFGNLREVINYNPPVADDLLISKQHNGVEVLYATKTYTSLHEVWIKEIYAPGVAMLVMCAETWWHSAANFECMLHVVNPFATILSHLAAQKDTHRVTGMIDALIVVLKNECSQLRCTHDGWLRVRSAMAALHRSLRLSLGISRDTGFVQCEYIRCMKRHSIEDCLCAKTLEELNFLQKITQFLTYEDTALGDTLEKATCSGLDTSLIDDFSMFKLKGFTEKSRSSQDAICTFVDQHLQSIPETIGSLNRTQSVPLIPRKNISATNPFKVGLRSAIAASEDLAITREPLQELVQKSREVPALVDCEGLMEVHRSKFSCTVAVVPGSFARLHECDYCGSLKVCGSAQNIQHPSVQQDAFVCRVCKKIGSLRVITDFPSHGHAYEYLIRQPEGLTLLLPGLLLVRRGGVWLHLVSSEKLTEENMSNMLADVPSCLPESHAPEEGSSSEKRTSERFFFYQLLDTANFLHLQYLNRAHGKMFGQVIFPLAQLLRKGLLAKMQCTVKGKVQGIDNVKTPHGELLDWLRQFEFLPLDHELRRLFRSEHKELTQAVTHVSRKVTMATTADVFRGWLEEAHAIFADKKACDTLQAETSFFDALLGFVKAEDSRNQLLELLDDRNPKHPAQAIKEESFQIVKFLGGERRQIPTPSQASAPEHDLEAIEKCLRSGTALSSGNGCTGWRSIAAMQPVDDVSGGMSLMGDERQRGAQQGVPAKEQLKLAAYEKVHSLCGPPVDHLCCQCLDPVKHHQHYTSAEGLQVSYMLPVYLLRQRSASTSQDTPTREGLNWVVDVLRSPMSVKLKEMVLYNLAAKSGQILTDSDSYAQVRDELENHGNEIMQKIKTESPDDKWVLHGLQQACPFSEMKEFLSTWTNGLGVSDKEQEFAKRRRGRYGVHFVPLAMADRRRGVPKVNARVEKVQLRRHFKSGLMAAPAVFKLIESSFTANCHFVAVYGLPSIPDELLKWLAEFTAANPWRIVFLMDTDAALKLPENLDRCIFHANMQRTLPNLTKVKLQPPSMQTTHSRSPRSIRRRANQQWKQCITMHLNSEENNIPLLLVGGPGIGKTHTAESQIRDWCNQQEFNYMTLDGSSPALINSSLSDFLERAFTKSHARKIVFVVDEWHMMSDERKRQAFQFFLTELRVIPILLSNRYDSTDEDLLKLAYGNSGFKADQHIVACSLTSDEYISIMISTGWLDLGDQISKERVCYFLEAMRMMFGDEVIGLSMREDLKHMCDKFDNQKHACQHMSKILEIKVPYLDPTWRDRVLLPCLYDFMRKPQVGSPAFPENASDVLGYLLPTAQWSEEMASYIEYVRDHVPNSFKHHPHHLIFSYLMYRSQFADVEVDEALKQKMFQACCRQNVVGMPMLFPRFLVDPKPADEYTDVVCQDVDPSNLHAVIHALKRGMSPDWTQCEERWKIEGITDVVAFIQLVSVWPDAVHYVGKQNLFDLLESSGDEGMALARTILNELSAESGDPKEPMNLFFMASWWCYRFQGSGAIISGEQGEKRFAATQDGKHFEIAGFKVNLLSLLSWASANAHHQTKIFNMRIEDFTAALKSDLVAVSEKQERPMLGLWDQQFAFLLTVGNTTRDIPWAWMASLVEEMSYVHHPPPAEWPEEARALFELWEGTMHPPMAEFLAVDSFFDMLRHLEEERTERYLRHLFRAVQEAQQQLPSSMQEKLLTAGLAFPAELAQPALAKTLLVGLRALQEKQLAVNMPLCVFRDCLKDVADVAGLSCVA